MYKSSSMSKTSLLCSNRHSYSRETNAMPLCIHKMSFMFLSPRLQYTSDFKSLQCSLNLYFVIQGKYIQWNSHAQILVTHTETIKGDPCVTK